MIAHTPNASTLARIRAALNNAGSLLPTKYPTLYASPENVKLISPLPALYKDVAALCNGFTYEAQEQDVAGLCIGLSATLHIVLSICGDDIVTYIDPEYLTLQDIAAIDDETAKGGLDTVLGTLGTFYPNMRPLVEVADVGTDLKAKGICQGVYTIHRALVRTCPSYAHVADDSEVSGAAQETQTTVPASSQDTSPLDELFAKLVELSQYETFSFRFTLGDPVRLEIRCGESVKVRHIADVARVFPEAEIISTKGVISFVAPLFT